MAQAENSWTTSTYCNFGFKIHIPYQSLRQDGLIMKTCRMLIGSAVVQRLPFSFPN